jgi:glycosyltransferase involved in cell wall biosynthesis
MQSKSIHAGKLAPAVPSMSIVVCAYNVQDYIQSAIKSALSQTLCTEVIVVDDGSVPPIAEFLPSNLIERIILVRTENCGLSAARNTGTSLSRSSYVCFIDGDDKIHESHCEQAYIQFKQQQDLDVYVPNAILFGESNANGFLPGGAKEGDILFDNTALTIPITFSSFLSQSTKLLGCSIFKKSSLIKTGGYPQDLRMAEDFFVHAKALMDGQKYMYAKIPTYFYRRHSAAMTTRDPVVLFHWVLCALDKLKKTSPDDTHLRIIRHRENEIRAEIQTTAFKRALEQRHFKTAAQLLKEIDVASIKYRQRRIKFKIAKFLSEVYLSSQRKRI